MRITISDIAKIAGVSTATVSKVINGKTHDIGEKTIKKVQKILEEQNYVPNQLARSMRTNKSQTIGLIIPDIKNAFFTDIARGAEDECSKSGYSLFFCNSDDRLMKEMNYLNSLAEKRVDGILIAGATERDKNKEYDFQLNIPAISIDRKINYNFIVSSVETENDIGSFDAVNYLVQNGHHNILYLAGPCDNLVAEERLKGYRRALQSNDIDIVEEDIIHGEFDTDSGYSRVMNVPNIEKYTAIFCANDMIAFGVINALNVLKIDIPNKISVVGVDDVEFSKFTYPSLTTVNQSAYDLGKISVRLMIEHINGYSIPKTNKLRQYLTIRNSVRNLTE